MNPNDNDMVVVRFLFGGALFFAAVMSRRDAEGLMRGFLQGQLPPRIGDGKNWTVNTASIHCMHVINPGEEQQVASKTGQMWTASPKGSGLN